MKIIEDIKLDYDDVLLIPKRSFLNSRSEVDITREFKFPHSNQKISGVPIVVANMAGVGVIPVAKKMAEYQMFTALHKFYSKEELVEFLNQPESQYCFVSIGLYEDVENLKDLNLKMICIDVANGYTPKFEQRVAKIRLLFPDAIIMAGNVCTKEMTEQLIISGADIVKVGLGSGACCLTRVVSGIGYPQFSAVIECCDSAHGLNGLICADGGIINPGDIAKSFGAGSDFVMIGSMFAGHEECLGEWEYQHKIIDGPVPAVEKEMEKKNFIFYGMSSKYAQDKHNGGYRDYKASEGKVVKIPYKGPIQDTIQQVLGGLRSACTYTGARRLKDLPKCATFVRVNRTNNRSLDNYNVGV